MESRYEWKDNYRFTEKDFWHRSYRRPIIVIDKTTNQEHVFATIKTKDGKSYMEYNDELYNQEFWDFCCATAPESCPYVPKEFQTPTLQRVIANNSAWKYNLERMDLERVEKEEGKDAAIEICKTMVLRYKDAIATVPKEYLTDDLVNSALTTHEGALAKLSDEEKTDARCILSVSKWGRSLYTVPNDKKSILVDTENGQKPLYEIAVEVDGLAIKSVPKDALTIDLCLKALKSNPESIKNIPATMITPELIELANKEKVVLPPVHRYYVIESIKAWAKLNGEEPIEEVHFDISKHANDNAPYQEIKLTDMPYMFSTTVLKALNQQGITDLGQLFTSFEDPKFPTKFSPITYDLIAGTVNVLNCKFKRIDPRIDLDEKSIEYMMTKLGLPYKVAKRAYGYGKSIRDLINDFNEFPDDRSFSRFRSVADVSLNESFEKISIISSYYKTKEKEASRDNEIISLAQEVIELESQIIALEDRINVAVKKIVQLTTEKMKDGENHAK